MRIARTGYGSRTRTGIGIMSLAPDHNKVALRIDLPCLIGLEQRHQTAPIHFLRHRDTGGVQERRRQINQTNEIIDHSARLRNSAGHRTTSGARTPRSYTFAFARGIPIPLSPVKTRRVLSSCPALRNSSTTHPT